MSEVVKDIAVGDGRTLRAHDTGPGPSQVVIWHHGTPGTGALLAPLVAAAADRQMRLVSYDRPGYGGSTAVSDRNVASAADDVAVVADALRLDRFAVMGASGGGPHALACAAGLDMRVTGVACLASPAPWMWIGFDIGLSGRADRQLSRWEEAFVPMRLADSLDEARLADGRPLVLSEQLLLPHRIAPEPPDRPRPWWPWLLAGLVFGAIVLLAARAAPRALGAAAGLFWLASGLLGVLMLFLWLGTEHRFAWANENLLLFDPLALLLLPGAWRIAAGRAPGTWFRRMLAAVAALAVAALLLKWVLLFSQVNEPWIALLLPVHLAFYAGLRRR